MTEVLICEQAGCPLVTEGQCLEGFTEVDACPHTRPASEVDDTDDVDRCDVKDADTGGDDDADEDNPAADSRWVFLGGDAPLSVQEADQLAAHAPCRVVLVAGEFESGKTTLVVELYAQFLQGSFGGAHFGGSRTLRALDKRHHPAREKSGHVTPKTERTADEDMRLLHLRLRRHGRLQDLLLSDVKGEFFENIVDGAGVAREVPLATRADLCLLMVDGASVANTIHRQSAVTRARLLLGGLCESDGLRPGTTIAIVLTKIDLIAPADRPWAEAQLTELRQWALGRGFDATALCVAARPPDGPPEGLELLLDYFLPPPRPRKVAVPPAEPCDRQFWNQPEMPS